MATQTAKALTPAEEHVTKFRPSENFKHMKKYLKSKFEIPTANSCNDSPQFTSPSPSAHNEGIVKPITEIQPPLPPYSPPPGVYIKQEVDTTDYQDRQPEPCLEFSQPDTAFNTSIAAPRETMCRNFVRGTCKKEYTCKFVHKIIKEQLKLVYTFCKEFQNKGCTRPRCGFVHCTVFEQEHFYRTGQLPPHATEHIKQHPLEFQRTMLPEDQLHASSEIVPHPYMNTSFETSSTVFSVGSTPPTTHRTDSTDYGQGVYQYEPACSTSSNERPWTCDNRTDSTDYGQGVYQYEPACSTSSNERPWTCDNRTDSTDYGQSVYQYEPACSTSSNERPWTFANRTDSTDYGQGVYQYEPACSTSSNQRPWTCDNRTDSTDYGQGVYHYEPACSTSSNERPWTCANGTDSTHHGQGVYQYEPACSTSSNERPWPCDTAYSQRDLDFREQPLKKCIDCDTNEFRCEFYKNKAKEMIVASDDREQKLSQLRRKTQRLMEILQLVDQPMTNLSDINL